MSHDLGVMFTQALAVPCLGPTQYGAAATGTGRINIDGKVVNGSIAVPTQLIMQGAAAMNREAAVSSGSKCGAAAAAAPYGPFQCVSTQLYAMDRPAYYDGYAASNNVRALPAYGGI
jgi:hypothetical protein